MKSLEIAKEIVTGYYPLLDESHESQWPLDLLCEEVLKVSRPLIQVRAKQMPLSRLKDLLMRIVYLKIHNPFKLIINQSLELVLALDADGIHLNENQTDIFEYRRLLGEEKVIGQSVHSLEAAVNAQKKGVDYITFGSLYPSGEKKVHGLDELKEIVAQVQIPVVAIGGICEKHLPELKAAKVQAFSVIKELLHDGNPSLKTAALQHAWDVAA